MFFEDLPLPEFLQDNIMFKKWENATPIQQLVIPKALEGADILGGAPTGTGKSGAFLIPIIARLCQKEGTGIRALVLEPSRELATQVAKEAQSLIEGSPLTCGTIIGGAGRDEQLKDEKTITIATPGRLLEFLHKEKVYTDHIELLIIDEADRMLDMGFRDDVATIVRACNRRFQTMLFSATLEGKGIRDFATDVLNNPFEVKLQAGDNGEKLPEQLQLRAYYAAGDEQKAAILIHLMTTAHGRSIVFVKTRDRIKRVASILKRNRFKCATLEGEMTQNEREAAISRFKEGQCDILVATDIAARGLDIPDIRYVYNFDMPGNAAIFTHRAGRTARAGASGTTVLLVCADQLEQLSSLERYTSRQVERRQIRNVCASFPTEDTLKNHPSEKKRARNAGKQNGGFDKKHKEEEQKRLPKKRWRDQKNKGKPDFALKRQKKAALKNAQDATKSENKDTGDQS